MSIELEFIVYAILIGIGATLVIDLWAQFLQRVFAIPALNWGLVGRWLGHFRNGKLSHESIVKASPVKGENIIGWIAHYLIGIVFAASFLAIEGFDWARNPSLIPALIFGAATVIFPFFVMQPCMGLGIAAAKTPNPLQARIRSLLTHTIFGFGMFCTALLAAKLIAF
ncbi:DUF2938 domain-containing protein [Deefgea rivuli]|uniref:DUF2938 domain-containing protein n=1 Tax=Deefgea rivuli TaxID=400948 RepID=UPI00047F4A91|nr:DUF2938 domain-containing protein [Deefgea rivuli]